jgi:uncharacterized membrane protein YebE (DUF533 family)
MQRPRTFLDLLLMGLMGLMGLAAFGALVFVLITDAVPRHLKAPTVLGLLAAAGLFACLAFWFAVRGSMHKAEAETAARDESLRDSAIVA